MNWVKIAGLIGAGCGLYLALGVGEVWGGVVLTIGCLIAAAIVSLSSA